MLNKLFSSKTRVEILKLFLFNADNSFYQRQISSLTNQPIRGIQREVVKLQQIGFLDKSIQIIHDISVQAFCEFYLRIYPI